LPFLFCFAVEVFVAVSLIAPAPFFLRTLTFALDFIIALHLREITIVVLANPVNIIELAAFGARRHVTPFVRMKWISIRSY
jgi:hypothetical protein